MTHFKSKKIGPFLLLAVGFLIILMMSAHVFGAVFLSNMIFSIFSLRNPILYVLVGLVIGAVVLFKFKQVLSHMHRRKENR